MICTKLERMNGEKLKKGKYGGSLLQRKLNIDRTSDENGKAYADNIYQLLYVMMK